MAKIEYSLTKQIYLSQYVSSYNSAFGSIDSNSLEKIFTTLYPSDFFYLVFCLEKETFELSDENNNKTSLYGVYLVSNVDKIVRVFLKNNRVNYFFVTLKSNATFDLFNLCLSDLRVNCKILDFVEIDKEVQTLFLQLKSVKSHQARVLLFEKYLNKFIKKNKIPYSYSIINQTLHSLSEKNMTELQNESKLSKVTLNQRIQKITGLSFQKLKKLKRFNIALAKINISIVYSTKISLTDIALETGYYDQNHFIKSFKEYTKMTPKKYIKNAQNQILFPSKYFNGIIQ